MSTIKISQLPELTQLDSNTANTLLIGVDVTSGTTGKLTANTLARGLYSFNPLFVGFTSDAYPGLIAQFTSSANSTIFINAENTNANGSADYIATATGTGSNNFIDFGITGRTFNSTTPNRILGDCISKLDGYLFVKGNTSGSVVGGNLVIGTTETGTETRFLSGGTDHLHVVAKATPTGLTISQNKYLTFGDGTTQNTAANPPIVALSAYDQANTATYNANSASIYANSAIALANTKFNSNGGIISGTVNIISDLIVTGNVSILGNTVNLLSALKFNDPLLYLANSNPGDTVDIGFIADYFSGNVAHAGLIREPNIKEFIFFHNYGPEIGSTNQVNIADPTFAYANVNAQTYKGNLISTTANVSSLTVSGNTQANGFITLYVPNTSNKAPLRLLSSANSAELAPSLNGYLIHISGKENDAARIIIDCFSDSANAANTWASTAGRRARGTAQTPLPAANNDILYSIAGLGWANSGFAGADGLGSARLDMTATQNFSNTARGTSITFWNTPNDSNVAINIATFDANNAIFHGTITPQKGFIYSPNVQISSAITLDFTRDVMIKSSSSTGFTITPINFIPGKVVEVWLVNTAGTTQTLTHGLAATNSTKNATTFNMPSTSCAKLTYSSIATDIGNTFVAITAG